jgi:RNA polymerase sigma factor (sigma-70 family)
LSVAFRSTDFSASLARSRAERIVATDGELLMRFVRHRDHDAFSQIVERHGRLVWMICYQVLRHLQDVEDAFQATFLILAERAHTIRASDSAASWLFGVAQRTALAARRKRERRREEPLAIDPPAGEESLRSIDKREMLYVLMQEIQSLPNRYHTPLVMRYLEGQSRRTIAEHTDSTVGQIQGRLVRGRRLLRTRFLRRGVSLSLAAGAVAVTAASAEAAVTPALIDLTAETCLNVKTSGALSGLPPAVLALVREGVNAMWFTFVSKCVAVVSATVLAGGIVWAAQGNNTAPSAGEGAPAQVQLQKEVQGKWSGAAENEQGKERGAFIASRFKYKIPFEIGATEFKEGGRIEIEEVWGTRPRIEVGGQYIVRGKYVLPHGKRGKLYFYETANGEWGRTPTANMDLQTVDLDEETGEFQLAHGMAGPGNFHLYLASPDKYSRMFANVYFGTDSNVLRKSNSTTAADGTLVVTGHPASATAGSSQPAADAQGSSLERLGLASAAPATNASPADSKIPRETVSTQQTSVLQVRQLELERDAWRLKAEAFRLKAQNKKTTLADVAGKNIIPRSEESQGRADVMLMEAEAKLAEAKEAELGAQLESLQKTSALHDSNSHQNGDRLAKNKEASEKILRPGNQIVVTSVFGSEGSGKVMAVDNDGKIDFQDGTKPIDIAGLDDSKAVEEIRNALGQSPRWGAFRIERVDGASGATTQLFPKPVSAAQVEKALTEEFDELRSSLEKVKAENAEMKQQLELRKIPPTTANTSGKILRSGDQIVVARMDKKSGVIKTAEIVTIDKDGKLTSDSQPGWPSIRVGGMEVRQAEDAIRRSLEEAYPKDEFRVEGP